MINLRHFKKIKSDKDSTTMQHPSGHMIQIAHKALSHNHKKYLDSIPLKETQKFAEGGEVKPEPSFMDKLSNMFLHNDEAQVQTPQIAPMPIQQVTQPQIPTQQQAPMQQNPQVAPETMGVGQETQMLQSGMENMIGGQQQAAQAKSQMEQELAKQKESQISEQQGLMQKFQESHDEVQNTIQNTINDFATQKINPNHYMDSMSSAGKVSTAIGMLLSGIGSGLSGQKNMAVDFLDKQIERDIDAQKANINNKNTLFSMNMAKFKNEQDAINMTRLQMGEIYATQAQLAAAKSGSQTALAAAQQYKGEIQTKFAPLAGQLMMKQAVTKAISGGQLSPESSIRYMKAGNIMDEHAATEATKELGQAREHQNAIATALNAFDQVNNMTLKGAFSPNQKAAYIKPIVAAMSKATAGRFTDSDAEMLEPLFPKVTDGPGTAAIKRSQLTRILTEKANYPTLDSYGINPLGSGSTQIQEKPVR